MHAISEQPGKVPPRNGTTEADSPFASEAAQTYLKYGIGLTLLGVLSYLAAVLAVARDQLLTVRGIGPLVFISMLVTAAWLVRRGKALAAVQLLFVGA